MRPVHVYAFGSGWMLRAASVFTKPTKKLSVSCNIHFPLHFNAKRHLVIAQRFLWERLNKLAHGNIRVPSGDLLVLLSFRLHLIRSGFGCCRQRTWTLGRSARSPIPFPVNSQICKYHTGIYITNTPVQRWKYFCCQPVFRNDHLFSFAFTSSQSIDTPGAIVAAYLCHRRFIDMNCNASNVLGKLEFIK